MWVGEKLTSLPSWRFPPSRVAGGVGEGEGEGGVYEDKTISYLQ